MSKMSTKATLPFHSVDSFYRSETIQRAGDSSMSWPCNSEDRILACQPWNFTKNSFRRGGLGRKMTYFFDHGVDIIRLNKKRFKTYNAP